MGNLSDDITVTTNNKIACVICHRILPCEEFYRDSSSISGYSNKCK